jgi:hypothetical protein
MAVEANVRILESRSSRKRESLLVLGQFADSSQTPAEYLSIEHLRLSLRVVIDEVMLTAKTTKRIAAEYLDGQNVLFSDAQLELEDQIETMVHLCAAFNYLANWLGQPPLDLGRIRQDLESRIEREVSTAAELALESTLSQFGDEPSRYSTMIAFARKHRKHPDPSADDASRANRRRMQTQTILSGACSTGTDPARPCDNRVETHLVDSNVAASISRYLRRAKPPRQ